MKSIYRHSDFNWIRAKPLFHDTTKIVDLCIINVKKNHKNRGYIPIECDDNGQYKAKVKDIPFGYYCDYDLISLLRGLSLYNLQDTKDLCNHLYDFDNNDDLCVNLIELDREL